MNSWAGKDNRFFPALFMNMGSMEDVLSMICKICFKCEEDAKNLHYTIYNVIIHTKYVQMLYDGE